MPFDALISFHDVFCVDRQFLVGIYNNAEQTRICLRTKNFMHELERYFGFPEKKIFEICRIAR